MKEKKCEEVPKMYYDANIKMALEKSVDLDYPVLLVGETGAGKTSFIRDIALDRGIELIRLNLTGQTGVDELLGKWLVKGKEMIWIDGLLIDAMKTGKWIVLDEINMALPEILSSLHSLLDDDKSIVLKEAEGEKIVPHERFRFFATMNPSDEYTGTKELNKAFFSRFPIVIDVNYSEEEVKILNERTGIKEKDAERLVLMANELRKRKLEESISYICSTRDLIYCSNLIMQGFNTSLAFELSILNKVHLEDKEKVKKVFELITGENIKINTDLGIKNFKSLDDIQKFVKEATIKERKVEKEKKIIKGQLTTIMDEVSIFKKKVCANEKKLKNDLIGKKVHIEAIEENVTKLLVKCKVPKESIEALFSDNKKETLKKKINNN